MIEVFPKLWVGDWHDEQRARGKPDWFVISAARDPWHRAALGYFGERGAPKGHPEYLIARRPGHLILNLVDAADPAYINREVVMAAVDAIADNIGQRQVLLHCNQGRSRSPTIALLFLCLHDAGYARLGYDAAVRKFTAVYPDYDPAAGMAGFARSIWGQ